MRFTPPDGVLNLAQTLDCGQSFRFYPVTLENNIPAWRGVAFSREVLSALHPALKEAAEFAGGIRILKQEPFEALCSFIISQNNNIPRIKKIIEALCAYCGAPLDTPRGRRYAFPAAQALARLSENELRALGCGFRARYIADAARRVASGVLELDRLPLSQAGGALCEICGVGEKVSACVRLYGFGDLSAFPVDVWIRRSLQSHFEDGFDAMHAGIYGGVAQQYLFYYERYILAHRKK